MKACEDCRDRVNIGCHHEKKSVLSRSIGLIFIYLPILTLPFVILSAYLTYFSLRCVGAENVKTWQDFIPKRSSHRYTLKNQITMKSLTLLTRFSLAQSKLYWILNCTWYCPYSVALFEWHTYLVKVVENWWCPFTHSRKHHYQDGAIDRSFWHLRQDNIDKLHPEDRLNPIFYDASEQDQNSVSK